MYLPCALPVGMKKYSSEFPTKAAKNRLAYSQFSNVVQVFSKSKGDLHDANTHRFRVSIAELAAVKLCPFELQSN